MNGDRDDKHTGVYKMKQKNGKIATLEEIKKKKNRRNSMKV